MRIDIPISGPSKQDRAIQASPQRSVNMFPSIKTPGSVADVVMYSHAGRSLVTTAGLGPHRANPLQWKGKLYFVSGTEFHSMDSSRTTTLLNGTAPSIKLLTKLSRCSMIGGKNYIVVVDGTHGYYYDGTNFLQITDSNFPANPTHVVYMNGFFCVNEGGTNKWHICHSTEDPTVWNALDFALANIKNQNVTALATHDTSIYTFGPLGIQRWWNNGNVDFPFTSYPNAISIGIEAPYSVADSPFGLFWLGTNEQGDRFVSQTQGNGPAAPIQDDETNWQINQLSMTSDAVGWVRRLGGQTFYELNFPTAGRTFSYCIEQQMFSERKSYPNDYLSAAGCGSLTNAVYECDLTNGNIYLEDYGTYTDNSQPLVRIRRTRVVNNKGLGLVFRKLQLDLDAGVGRVTGFGTTPVVSNALGEPDWLSIPDLFAQAPTTEGVDPQVMLRYSTDGGKTFSSELWRSMGKVGEQNKKPEWNNLGMGYDWVFEFACSDPVPFNLFNLWADILVARA